MFRRKAEDVGVPSSECRAMVTSVYVRVLDETQLGQVLGLDMHFIP